MKINILEEYQARINKYEEEAPNAMIVRSSCRKGKELNKKPQDKMSYRTKFICYRCRKPGHRAAVCTAPAPVTNESFAEVAGTISGEFALHSATNIECNNSKQWCLDSGATSHMTSDAIKLENFKKIRKPLCLANNYKTLITGVGEINV